MKVFKFGGASVGSPERIANVASIIKQYKGEKLLVVISAMGKTTNALEKVAEAFYKGEKENALVLFEDVKNNHTELLYQLLKLAGKPAEPLQQIQDFYTEVEWLLHDKPVRGYDYYYDQIVCIGELLSTAIISHYFICTGLHHEWIDVRDIIRTDNNFRDARIDWDVTVEKTARLLMPLFESSDMILTQGFIGATDENESTTLGREGSDYTAAVFASIMNAESQTIWKDVQGVMNADPKLYNKATWIKELNYREVIEMAYYGAQVIHPKTIKPLQNGSIPLFVKSFLHPDQEGTIIHQHAPKELPPIIVHKAKQVMVQLNTKDYSFIGEGQNLELFRIFNSLAYSPNLTQNGAIGMICIMDDHPEKTESFSLMAAEIFDVTMLRGLSLLTIRHYNEEIIDELIDRGKVMLRQQTPETIQVVLKG